jgi:hypothetical protein
LRNKEFDNFVSFEGNSMKQGGAADAIFGLQIRAAFRQNMGDFYLSFSACPHKSGEAIGVPGIWRKCVFDHPSHNFRFARAAGTDE